MEKITLSIFVPCFNEEKNITNTLDNIKNGVIDISYEILIVDDASKDKTIEMVEIFKKNNPNLDIKIITLYVLSAENYNRKKEELNELFN